MTITGGPDGEGTYDYVLTVPNYRRKKISFLKVDVINPETVLEGAVFDLYRLEDDGETRKLPALYTGLTSGGDGLAADSLGHTVFELPAGVYHLVETSAPENYILKQAAVVITVSTDGVIYDEGTNLSASGLGKTFDEETQVYTLRVTNSAGIELPYTGGPGPAAFRLAGIVLMLLAGAALLIRRKEAKE